jgi:cobyrinic acid a,c-diamide synthase
VVSARAILVAAAASGQGKTTVTAALARRLRRDGARVRVFKTGPDFLDPLTLARASGAEVDTLDLWMVGEAGCRQRLAAAAQDADWILVEAVMGLYDGAPSSADLANRFGLPVLAVLDARAMAQTAGALALGLRDYGPVQLAGVLANRVAGDSHAAMVAESLRDIPLLGHLPRQAQSLPERHLGLGLPDELADFDVRDALADQGLIDSQEALALTKALADLNLVNQEFNAQVLETKQSGVFDQEARIKLKVLLGNVIGSIDRLNRQGVLMLHNEEAQRRMSLAVRSIQTAVNLVWEVLEK